MRRIILLLTIIPLVFSSCISLPGDVDYNQIYREMARTFPIPKQYISVYFDPNTGEITGMVKNPYNVDLTVGVHLKAYYLQEILGGNDFWVTTVDAGIISAGALGTFKAQIPAHHVPYVDYVHAIGEGHRWSIYS